MTQLLLHLPDDLVRRFKRKIAARQRSRFVQRLLEEALPPEEVGDFDPPRGSEIRKTRPAVVITADALNRARRTVVVVPLSTGPEPRPPIVIATPSAGARTVAVCDQLRAVDKARLNRASGRVSAADLR